MQYQSEERQIGVFSGSKLYQQGLQFTTGPTASTVYNAKTISIPNLKEFINLEYFVNINGVFYTCSFYCYLNKVQNIFEFIGQISGETITFKTYSTDQFLNKPVYVVMQYTKTTG